MYYFKILKYAYVAAQAVHFISLSVKYTGQFNASPDVMGKLTSTEKAKGLCPNADSFMR
jgi:hypothetical protein